MAGSGVRARANARRAREGISPELWMAGNVSWTQLPTHVVTRRPHAVFHWPR